MILVAAILANVVANLRFPELLDAIPVIGLAVWIVILITAPLRRPDWEVMPETAQGHDLPSRAGDLCFADAGRGAPGRFMADRTRPRVSLRGLRQHPAHRARPEARRLRLGISRLCGRLRRVDDLVRLIRRRGPVQHVSRRRSRSAFGCATAGASRSPTSSHSLLCSRFSAGSRTRPTENGRNRPRHPRPLPLPGRGDAERASAAHPRPLSGDRRYCAWPIRVMTFWPFCSS